MFYLGIDQHARHLTVNCRDEDGQVVFRRQVSTQWKAVRTFLSQVQRDSQAIGGFMVIVEVCGFNDWLIKLLKEYDCKEVVLAQPQNKSKQKTDRRDANQLSELLWINRHRLGNGLHMAGIRRVYIPTDEERDDRYLTRQRQRIGRQISQVICQIKDLLRRHNLQHDCPTKGIGTQKARAWLKGLSLGDMDRMALDQLLVYLELHEAYRQKLQTKIEDRQAQHKAAAVIATIPGAAAYTSLGLACRVGPLERFRTSDSFANFLGLAPGINDSGETKGRIGSITKRGSAIARFLLGQLATHVLRKDAGMMRWYKAIRKRRGSKIARVAVMRRLATIIWHMLKTGECYRFNQTQVHQKHAASTPQDLAITV